MTEYLNIDRKEQSTLLKSIKRGSGLTWNQIWEYIGVSKSMVYFYRSGACRIPKEKLLKMMNISKYSLDISSLSFVKANYSLQVADISKMNDDMAEFLGILYGDGCLGTNNFHVDVSGDSKSDFLYHTLRVKPLITKLFGLSPRFKFEKQKQEMHTMLYSKMIHDHISKEFLFPIGHKKGRMNIPAQVYFSNEYKKAFLRGLFDTDGGVHRHHNTSIQIQITSADEIFKKQVQNLLLNFGFNARINDWDIQIRGKKEIDRFFEEIRPANPKHMYKYKVYKETGVVPLHRDIDYSVLNKETDPVVTGLCQVRAKNTV